MAAAVSCLRLGRGWRGAGSSVGRRRLCQGPRHSESDLELHRGYSGFLPRYRAARSLLFTQEGEEKFESYVEAKVGGGFLSKMIVLADLEHPLFLKYNFDVKDFMEGAKHAFETIMGDAYHSKEFADYVSGYGEEVVENQEEVYGEGTLEKVSEILQQRHGEEPKQQDHSRVENLESENQRSEGDEEGGGNSDVSHISGKGQPPQSLSKEDFLYSVCTESGFQDFVDILKLEMRVKDKFAIFEENIESYFMSRALINVEEEDEEHDNKNEISEKEVEGQAVGKCNPDPRYKVMAHITVTFKTTCGVKLHIGEGIEPKQWKMVRLFNWTFCGQLNDERGIEWRISEVNTGPWD